jgi:serine/threonine protein phosphatase PrpC
VNTTAAPGSPFAIYGVYDGHGGFAVSEWLKTNLASVILEEWPKADFCLEAISQACLKADYTLIQPPGGFLGAFGERGVGGAKCGSTAVVAVLFEENGVRSCAPPTSATRARYWCATAKLCSFPWTTSRTMRRSAAASTRGTPTCGNRS